jgi:hypothetical protein
MAACLCGVLLADSNAFSAPPRGGDEGRGREGTTAGSSRASIDTKIFSTFDFLTRTRGAHYFIVPSACSTDIVSALEKTSKRT